jgi:hypothetical protein
MDAEQDEFMRLVRRMDGRGVDLRLEYGYEVEARCAAAAALRAANPKKARELELRIIESKSEHGWEQPEVLFYLTSDAQGQLRGLSGRPVPRGRLESDQGGR